MGSEELEVKFISPTAIIHPTAKIGEGTKVWTFVQIAEHAQIGNDCVIGNGTYIDRHVRVGNRVRIHNKALIYDSSILEDDVFIGPGVCLTNDEYPRSGKTKNLKGHGLTVEKGASIGANATVLPNVRIGSYALVGAGAVVTKNVSPHHVVCGNPARQMGYVCFCGAMNSKKKFKCSECGKSVDLA